MRDNDFKTSCHHMSTCALTGASAFFDAIPGSFMLINGPLWCYFYAMKYVEDYDLLAGLDFVKANFTPERVFLLNNCSVSLVGDDIAGIAAKAELPCPVYAADCGGIAGDFAEGYEIALLRVIAEVKKNAEAKRDLADVSEANSKNADEAKVSENLNLETIDCKPSVNLSMPFPAVVLPGVKSCGCPRRI